jgi:hypothetical protein
MRGIPGKVIEWDGFTVKIKYNHIYLIDIFNSWKVLENLLKNIGLEKPHPGQSSWPQKAWRPIYSLCKTFLMSGHNERTD